MYPTAPINFGPARIQVPSLPVGRQWSTFSSAHLCPRNTPTVFKVLPKLIFLVYVSIIVHTGGILTEFKVSLPNSKSCSVKVWNSSCWEIDTHLRHNTSPDKKRQRYLCCIGVTLLMC